MYCLHQRLLLILYLHHFVFLLFHDHGCSALKIGAIIHVDSRLEEQKAAIELAVEELNNTYGIKISLNITDSGTRLLQLASTVESLVREWGADAIIDTNTRPKAALVADAIAPVTADVPLISFASFAIPSASSSPPRPPFLVRMSNQASTQMHCIAALVQSHHWHRVIAIYEDDPYGGVTEDITLLSEALQLVGVEIEHRLVLPPWSSASNSKNLVRERLEKLSSRRCKIFIVLGVPSPSLVLHLFAEAKRLGMMEKGHVWITGDDVTSFLASTTSSSISRHIQGVVGITTSFNESKDSYRDFKGKFRERLLSQDQTLIDPDISALRAYDAIHAIVIAATSKKNTTTNLLGGILSSDFEGLSGRIKFTTDGELLSNSSEFVIVNFIGRSYTEVGFWSQYSTLEPLGPMIWPGRAEKVPSGWGTLRIGVPGNAVLRQFVKVVPQLDTTKNTFEGFCIDVFKEAVGLLPYDLVYDFFPFNGSYEELVYQVAAGYYDAVVGDVTILPSRAEYVEFTQPYLDSGFSMMVPLKPNDNSWMFVKPFTEKMWIAIVGIFIYTAIVTWFLERRTNPTFVNSGWLRQLGNVLWFHFSTIFFAQGRLHNNLSRVVIMVWLFAVFILTTSYTASLSSILTVQKLQPVVTNGRIGYVGITSIQKYLDKFLHMNPANFMQIQGMEECLKAFKNGSITALYLETPYLRIFLSKHGEDYVAVGETLRLGGFGFVFPKGSPLAGDVSRAILNFTIEGKLKEIERKWFSFSLSNTPSPDVDKNRESLDLDSFWMLFAITGGTSTLVLLLFSLWLIRNRVSSFICRRIVPLARKREGPLPGSPV